MTSFTKWINCQFYSFSIVLNPTYTPCMVFLHSAIKTFGRKSTAVAYFWTDADLSRHDLFFWKKQTTAKTRPFCAVTNVVMRYNYIITPFHWLIPCNFIMFSVIAMKWYKLSCFTNLIQ